MDTIIFPSEVTVTDQVIDCTLLSQEKKKFVIEFTRELLARYHDQAEYKVCYGIAGPSGSGKSFLSVLAREIGAQLDPSVVIVPVSIDAFHFPNTYLESTIKEGKTLKQVKGRFDTYDVGELLAQLEKYKSSKGVIYFPEYSRKIHEPIQGAIRIEQKPTILLIEGLWLLYPEGVWGSVAPLLDYTYFIDDNEAESRMRTLNRHIVGGRDAADAQRHYDESDLLNRVLVLSTKHHASKLLIWPK